MFFCCLFQSLFNISNLPNHWFLDQWSLFLLWKTYFTIVNFLINVSICYLLRIATVIPGWMSPQQEASMVELSQIISSYTAKYSKILIRHSGELERLIQAWLTQLQKILLKCEGGSGQGGSDVGDQQCSRGKRKLLSGSGWQSRDDHRTKIDWKYGNASETN